MSDNQRKPLPEGEHLVTTEDISFHEGTREKPNSAQFHFGSPDGVARARFVEGDTPLNKQALRKLYDAHGVDHSVPLARAYEFVGRELRVIVRHNNVDGRTYANVVDFKSSISAVDEKPREPATWGGEPIRREKPTDKKSKGK